MTANAAPNANALALQRLYHWERAVPSKRLFVQPVGDGRVREWTWGEALIETRRMAAHLRALDLPPGSSIALISKNCAHWLMADWAIWMAGHVSVPLYPTLTGTSVRELLAHSGAKLLFVGKLDDWASIESGIPDALPCIAFPLSPEGAKRRFRGWDDVIEKSAPLQGMPTRDASELATIIYTSGTTGMAKGVMHSFGNFAAATAAVLARVPFTPNDRLLSYLPLSHIVERTFLEHTLLASGYEVFFAESLDSFIADLQRARPTRFASVPRLYLKFQQGVFAKVPEAKLARLLKLPVIGWLVKRKVLKGLGLDQCVYAGGGAAPMPPAMLEWYKRLGLEILEAYGMTENCGVSHTNVQSAQRIGTVGPAYPGAEVRLDAQTQEVQVRCAWTMQGYYRDEAATKAAFTADGFLKTGDKGAIDNDGTLKITGRVKDAFKTSKAKYVEPGPIEEKLSALPLLEACCVAGANLPQPVGLVMLGAPALAKASTAAGKADIEAALAKHLEAVNATLDSYLRLDALVVVGEEWTVDNGLITPTLKVKRARIDEVYGPHLERWLAGGASVVWAERVMAETPKAAQAA
ncbi:MAG: AMP-binding protein [Silanimonas sp.]